MSMIIIVNPQTNHLRDQKHEILAELVHNGDDRKRESQKQGHQVRPNPVQVAKKEVDHGVHRKKPGEQERDQDQARQEASPKAKERKLLKEENRPLSEPVEVKNDDRRKEQNVTLLLTQNNAAFLQATKIAQQA